MALPGEEPGHRRVGIHGGSRGGPEQSGALITARHGLDAGRDVWAVPGPPGVRECRGSNGLLADGAGVLWDIPEFVGAIAPRARGPGDRVLVSNVPTACRSRGRRPVRGGARPRGVDAVARRSGVQIPEVLPALAMLELKGFVSRRRGRVRQEGRSVTQRTSASSGRVIAGYGPHRRKDILRPTPVGRARGEGTPGPAGRQLLASRKVRCRKNRGRIGGPLDQEDIISSGLVGLLNAVETYDPGRRTKFESYAISKIRWSILDELRKWIPSRAARG